MVYIRDICRRAKECIHAILKFQSKWNRALIGQQLSKRGIHMNVQGQFLFRIQMNRLCQADVAGGGADQNFIISGFRIPVLNACVVPCKASVIECEGGRFGLAGFQRYFVKAFQFF